MGRKKKMENNENKNIGEVVTLPVSDSLSFSNSEEEQLSVTTTVTCTTTIRPIQKNTILYQIFIGDDPNEYYTWELPIFDYDEVKLSALIRKGTLTEDLYNGKSVEINYCEELSEEESFVTKSIRSGILFKAVDCSELDWLDKDLQTAINELKDESLNAYRELLPQLFKRLAAVENRKGNNNMNELIEF